MLEKQGDFKFMNQYLNFQGSEVYLASLWQYSANIPSPF